MKKLDPLFETDEAVADACQDAPQAVLTDAVHGADHSNKPDAPPLLVVDGGVENFNGSVDELVTDGLLRRVLALNVMYRANKRVFPSKVVVSAQAPRALDVDYLHPARVGASTTARKY